MVRFSCRVPGRDGLHRTGGVSGQFPHIIGPQIRPPKHRFTGANGGLLYIERGSVGPRTDRYYYWTSYTTIPSYRPLPRLYTTPTILYYHYHWSNTTTTLYHIRYLHLQLLSGTMFPLSEMPRKSPMHTAFSRPSIVHIMCTRGFFADTGK